VLRRFEGLCYRGVGGKEEKEAGGRTHVQPNSGGSRDRVLELRQQRPDWSKQSGTPVGAGRAMLPAITIIVFCGRQSLVRSQDRHRRPGSGFRAVRRNQLLEWT